MTYTRNWEADEAEEAEEFIYIATLINACFAADIFFIRMMITYHVLLSTMAPCLDDSATLRVMT